MPRNTRNSRSVQCNWKYPNCGNTTRDASGYCRVHQPLAARISGENLRYGHGETIIGNRSQYVMDGTQRNTIYNKNAARLEDYPVITVNKTPDGQYRAVIQKVTKPEVAARGITIGAHHRDGAVNNMLVTRESKDEAIYEASAIVAEIWGQRLDAMEAEDPNSIDTYDSYVEAVAYARDWSKEISELEAQNNINPNERTISFSQDRKTKQLAIKVYHQSKNQPEGFIEYDYITFENKLRSADNGDGTETYVPHMLMETPRSYRLVVDPETHQPKRRAGRDWSPVTAGLIKKVSKLVAESNKFGVSTSDGRLRLPTGWEIRSKSAGL